MPPKRSLDSTITRLSLLVLMMSMLQACDGGDSSDSDAVGARPVPEVCANIAGMWDVIEEVTVTCTAEGESETASQRGAGRTTITQNGCAISYVVPNVEVTRTGVIDGDHVRFSGPFVIALFDDVNLSQNTVTIEGELVGNTIALEGSGIAAGSVNGIAFDCTGDSTATFTRAGPQGVARMLEAPPSDGQSLFFLDDAWRLFLIMP
jgi:hypothetical protein